MAITDLLPPQIRRLFARRTVDHTVTADRATGTVTIGSTEWTTGLTWHQETRRTITPREARETAQREHHDLYAINAPTQVGTTSTGLGHRAGQPLLCIAITAKLQSADMLVVVRLTEDLFYIVASEHGAFRSGIESVLSEEEARGLFNDLELQHRRRSALIAAPEHWQVDDAQHLTITDVLPATTSGIATLQKLNNAPPKKAILTVIAAAAVAYGAYYLYKQYQYQQALIHAQSEARAEIDRQARAQLLAIPILPPMPSESMPRGNDSIRACLAAIDTLPDNLPGWTPTGIDCSPGQITMTLAKRPMGTVNWLAPFLHKYRGGTANIGWSPETPDSATVSWGMDPLHTKKWGRVDGQNPQRVARYLFSNMSEIYALGYYTLSPSKTQEVPTKTVGGTPVTIIAPWTVSTLTLTMKPIIHDDVIDIIARIQNATLVSMHVTLPDRAYTITENIYHYNPPAESATIVAGNPQ